MDAGEVRAAVPCSCREHECARWDGALSSSSRVQVSEGCLKPVGVFDKLEKEGERFGC